MTTYVEKISDLDPDSINEYWSCMSDCVEMLGGDIALVQRFRQLNEELVGTPDELGYLLCLHDDPMNHAIHLVGARWTDKIQAQYTTLLNQRYPALAGA